MKLGLNLSFAVKRWLDPVELAKMIKEDFGVDHVQFTWRCLSFQWRMFRVPTTSSRKSGSEEADSWNFWMLRWVSEKPSGMQRLWESVFTK